MVQGMLLMYERGLLRVLPLPFHHVQHTRHTATPPPPHSLPAFKITKYHHHPKQFCLSTCYLFSVPHQLQHTPPRKTTGTSKVATKAAW